MNIDLACRLADNSEDYYGGPRKNRIMLVQQSIAQAMRDLSSGKPVSAQDVLREGRQRLIRRLLHRAGAAAGYSIAYTGVLLGVTERTVRNWIAETELGHLFLQPRAHVRHQYRGIVTDPSGQIAKLYTPWCDSYGDAVRKSKIISYTYRMLDPCIEVEISEKLEHV